MARCGKVSNKLYFESKKESKLNQIVNIKTRSSSNVDNYYQDMKIVLKKLNYITKKNEKIILSLRKCGG